MGRVVVVGSPNVGLTVVAAARGAPVKAMLEATILAPEQLARATDLCVDAGVTYVKNSSGFEGGNATLELVAALRRLAAGRVLVKASGGIRTRAGAEALLAAGADLLGTSAGVSIVTGTADPSAAGNY